MRAAENADSLPRFRLEPFDGPLDLLLDEVRRQNVTIEKIAMAPIVARYLEYVADSGPSGASIPVPVGHDSATSGAFLRAGINRSVAETCEAQPLRGRRNDAVAPLPAE